VYGVAETLFATYRKGAAAKELAEELGQKRCPSLVSISNALLAESG
jgi:hypothetical protein